MAKNYKISLTLKKDVNEEPVYQKQDGQRFSKSQTVKLNINTDYVVKLVIRPAMKLQTILFTSAVDVVNDVQRLFHELAAIPACLSIHGERTEFEYDQPTKTKEYDDDAVFYKAKFSTTNYDTHNRGKRKDIPFLFEFEDGRSMQSSIQSKLYKAGETEHSSWGQALAWIEYDCQVKEGQTYVEILKEKYV